MSNTKPVIKYFIKEAPVGEVYQVLSDVAKVAGMEAIQSPEIKDAIRSHLEKHKCHVKVDGKLCSVNKDERQANVGDNFCYFDRREKIKFQFDPMNLDEAVKCEDQTDENPPAVDEAWEEYR